MKKFLRITWLVIEGIVFSPVLFTVMIWALIKDVIVLKKNGFTVKQGIGWWFNQIMLGIQMNKDFVNNGL